MDVQKAWVDLQRSSCDWGTVDVFPDTAGDRLCHITSSSTLVLHPRPARSQWPCIPHPNISLTPCQLPTIDGGDREVNSPLPVPLNTNFHPLSLPSRIGSIGLHGSAGGDYTFSTPRRIHNRVACLIRSSVPRCRSSAHGRLLRIKENNEESNTPLARRTGKDCSLGNVATAEVRLEPCLQYGCGDNVQEASHFSGPSSTVLPAFTESLEVHADGPIGFVGIEFRNHVQVLGRGPVFFHDCTFCQTSTWRRYLQPAKESAPLCTPNSIRASEGRFGASPLGCRPESLQTSMGLADDTSFDPHALSRLSSLTHSASPGLLFTDGFHPVAGGGGEGSCFGGPSTHSTNAKPDPTYNTAERSENKSSMSNCQGPRSALHLSGTTTCQLSQCEVYGGLNGTGVSVRDEASVVVLDCSFVGSSLFWAGVELEGEARLQANNLILRDICGCGVLATGTSHVLMEYSLLQRCGVVGVVATEAAQVRLVSTKIEMSECGTNVSVSGTAACELCTCTITARLPMSTPALSPTLPSPMRDSVVPLAGSVASFTSCGLQAALDTLWSDVMAGCFTSAQSVVVTDTASLDIRDSEFLCRAPEEDRVPLQERSLLMADGAMGQNNDMYSTMSAGSVQSRVPISRRARASLLECYLASRYSLGEHMRRMRQLSVAIDDVSTISRGGESFGADELASRQRDEGRTHLQSHCTSLWWSKGLLSPDGLPTDTSLDCLFDNVLEGAVFTARNLLQDEDEVLLSSLLAFGAHPMLAKKGTYHIVVRDQATVHLARNMVSLRWRLQHQDTCCRTSSAASPLTDSITPYPCVGIFIDNTVSSGLGPSQQRLPLPVDFCKRRRHGGGCAGGVWTDGNIIRFELADEDACQGDSLLRHGPDSSKPPSQVRHCRVPIQAWGMVLAEPMNMTDRAALGYVARRSDGWVDAAHAWSLYAQTGGRLSQLVVDRTACSNSSSHSVSLHAPSSGEDGNHRKKGHLCNADDFLNACDTSHDLVTTAPEHIVTCLNDFALKAELVLNSPLRASTKRYHYSVKVTTPDVAGSAKSSRNCRRVKQVPRVHVRGRAVPVEEMALTTRMGRGSFLTTVVPTKGSEVELSCRPPDQAGEVCQEEARTTPHSSDTVTTEWSTLSMEKAANARRPTYPFLCAHLEPAALTEERVPVSTVPFTALSMQGMSAGDPELTTKAGPSTAAHTRRDASSRPMLSQRGIRSCRRGHCCVTLPSPFAALSEETDTTLSCPCSPFLWSPAVAARDKEEQIATSRLVDSVSPELASIMPGGAQRKWEGLVAGESGEKCSKTDPPECAKDGGGGLGSPRRLTSLEEVSLAGDGKYHLCIRKVAAGCTHVEGSEGCHCSSASGKSVDLPDDRQVCTVLPSEPSAWSNDGERSERLVPFASQSFSLARAPAQCHNHSPSQSDATRHSMETEGKRKVSAVTFMCTHGCCEKIRLPGRTAGALPATASVACGPCDNSHTLPLDPLPDDRFPTKQLTAEMQIPPSQVSPLQPPAQLARSSVSRSPTGGRLSNSLDSSCDFTTGMEVLATTRDPMATVVCNSSVQTKSSPMTDTLKTTSSTFKVERPSLATPIHCALRSNGTRPPATVSPPLQADAVDVSPRHSMGAVHDVVKGRSCLKEMPPLQLEKLNEEPACRNVHATACCLEMQSSSPFGPVNRLSSSHVSSTTPGRGTLTAVMRDSLTPPKRTLCHASAERGQPLAVENIAQIAVGEPLPINEVSTYEWAHGEGTAPSDGVGRDLTAKPVASPSKRNNTATHETVLTTCIDNTNEGWPTRDHRPSNLESTHCHTPPSRGAVAPVLSNNRVVMPPLVCSGRLLAESTVPPKEAALRENAETLPHAINPSLFNPALSVRERASPLHRARAKISTADVTSPAWLSVGNQKCEISALGGDVPASSGDYAYTDTRQCRTSSTSHVYRTPATTGDVLCAKRTEQWRRSSVPQRRLRLSPCTKAHRGKSFLCSGLRTTQALAHTSDGYVTAPLHPADGPAKPFTNEGRNTAPSLRSETTPRSVLRTGSLRLKPSPTETNATKVVGGVSMAGLPGQRRFSTVVPRASNGQCRAGTRGLNDGVVAGSSDSTTSVPNGRVHAHYVTHVPVGGPGVRPWSDGKFRGVHLHDDFINAEYARGAWREIFTKVLERDRQQHRLSAERQESQVQRLYERPLEMLRGRRVPAVAPQPLPDEMLAVASDHFPACPIAAERSHTQGTSNHSENRSASLSQGDFRSPTPKCRQKAAYRAHHCLRREQRATCQKTTPSDVLPAKDLLTCPKICRRGQEK